MEPSELEIAIWERRCLGLVPIGPLTEWQAHDEAAYEDFRAEEEHESTLWRHRSSDSNDEAGTPGLRKEVHDGRKDPAG